MRGLPATRPLSKSLSEEARTRVWAAFSSIGKNPGMDNAFYYRTLRKGLHAAYRVVQRSGTVDDMRNMEAVLQNLWGISFAQAGEVASFDDPDRFKFRDFEEMKAIGMHIGEDENRDKVLAALAEESRHRTKRSRR